ncbi:uncharacterized protein LOC143063560 isoform X3 [Mytilus galloprovincialis]|uniref:uncharacterized protein LOC143063560 isoform X3 n=1 Tax=Mytilus galloprovincialis TaxID=29158 RepID=UPI003F7B9472
MNTMKIRTIPHILLFIWTFTYTEAFFPNPYGLHVGRDDFTHAEITEIGILKAVAAFYEETPLTPGGSTPSSGSLTGIQDITAKKLYDKISAGSRSPRRLQDAIDNIVRYNNKVDQDHYNEAAWHFNGEQIEPSNLKLQGIRTQLLSELNKPNPDYELSRQLIGQFLHILQMFYSNTNWIEDNGANKYPAVGMTGVRLLPTAAPSDDACKSCAGVCVFNIILPKKQFLTSGYKSGQDIKKPFKDPKTNTKGKCSHGGLTDNTTTTSAATGGMNKDSKLPQMSPHFYKHTPAAETAIDHTVYFFNDNTNGIRHLTTTENFMRLLQLDSDYSLVFVIDTSGSMASDLPTIIQQSNIIIQAANTVSNSPSNYILVTFSDPVTSIDLQKTTHSVDMITWINGLKAQGGSANDCPEFSLSAIESAANASSPGSIIYVFTDATPKDPYKQEKIDSLIAENQLQIFFTVTGTCSTTNHNGLKYSENSKPAIGRKKRDAQDNFYDEHNEEADDDKQSSIVLIVKETLSVLEPPRIQIPVDNTIEEIHIDIKGDTARPYPVLQKPNKEYVNMDGQDASKTILTENMISITIQDPEPGIWNLLRFDRTSWDIEVTGLSTLDFEYKISKDDIENKFVIEVTTDFRDKAFVMYNLIIGNPSGDIQKVGLNRTSENVYSCHVRKYKKDFVLAIEGLDDKGNVFQRFHHSYSDLSATFVASNTGHYRHRRATSWDLMDVYRHLASVSGGHMLQTTKDQIPYVANMFKASLSKSEVLILKNVFPGGPSTTKQINIDIDDSISQFTLKLHSKNDVPHFNLLNSNGNTQPIDNKTIHMYNIGTTYLSIVVDRPKTGSWSLRKNDMNEWDLEVTAQSTVDFTAKLMTYDASSFSYYQIHGRPIPDENVTLAIEINDKNIDLDRVSLLNVFDDEISHYSLQWRNKSSSRAFYMTTITIPHEFFKLAVVGTTKSTGNNFVRMHRNVIEIVNIKLDHLPEKDPLYLNEDLNVTFVIKNAGSQDEDVIVTIKDDKTFAVGTKSRTFHLKAWTNQTSYFTIHGGKTKGETTTITLTAKPAASTRSNSKFQQIITSLTVEERKVDKIPPVCNVTTTSISCNDPCKCSKMNAVVIAELWDEGEGLSEVTAPNTPPNSLQVHGFSKGLVKSKGTVSATLIIDCCRKNVTIDVKDLKNLTSSCDITIDPTYDATNPCTTTTTTTTTTPASTTPALTSTVSTSTSTVTKKVDIIPPVCNMTTTSISCNDPCKCSNMNAVVIAELWDEGDGLSEITAPNTPPNSLQVHGFSKGLVKSKGTVLATLIIDCCRKNVTIDVKDLKNLTSSCDITIDPTYDATNPCTTTTTTTTTTTPASTPVSTSTVSTSTSTVTKKVDTISPVCNVTTTSISCNDPCKCSKMNAFVIAELWDEGDGLSEITAPNTPPNSLQVHGFSKGLVKSKGTVSATLIIDCCRKNVTIDVKDLKNLTSSCDIQIDPTYDATNPCTTTTTTTITTPALTSTVSTSISTVTKKVDIIPPVCNKKTTSISCNDPCKCSRMNAFVIAELWDEGDGLSEITAPNSPPNSLQLHGFSKGLVKAKGTVSASLIIDCCRKNVTIYVKDLKNLTNSCDIPIDPTYDATNPCTTTTTTTTTTLKPTSTTTSLKSTTSSKLSAGISSALKNALVTSTQNPLTKQSGQTGSTTTTMTQNPSSSKEENSSSLSDGATYGIAAAVGAATLAVIIGAIALITKKLAAVSPKKTEED